MTVRSSGALVDVIIVSYKCASLLAECLNSIFDSECWTRGILGRIIVVDNQSKDGTVEQLESNYPTVCVREAQENLGYARANNLAFAETGAKYILLLNPDTTVGSDAIGRLVSALDHYPQVGLVGPALKNVDGTPQESSRALPTIANACMEVFTGVKAATKREIAPNHMLVNGYLCGACLLLRREALQRTTLYDDRYFMYSEEMDLCHELRDNGWSIGLCEAAHVAHMGGGSTSLLSDRMSVELYRSKLRYFHKYYGGFQAGLFGNIYALGRLTRFIRALIRHCFGGDSYRVHNHSLMRQNLRLIVWWITRGWHSWMDDSAKVR